MLPGHPDPLVWCRLLNFQRQFTDRLAQHFETGEVCRLAQRTASHLMDAEILQQLVQAHLLIFGHALAPESGPRRLKSVYQSHGVSASSLLLQPIISR